MAALPRARRAHSLAVAAAAVVAAVLAGVLLAGGGEKGAKFLALFTGVILAGLGASLMGNLRLFLLWGYILTLPFDLSYRFGQVLPKLGGETAFRIELSDLFWVPLAAYLLRDLFNGTLRGLRIPKVTYVWIAIGFMGIAAIITGPWRITAAQEVVRMLKIMLSFLVVLNEMRTPGRMMHVAMAIAAAILVQASAGIGQYLLGSGFGLEKLGESEVVNATNVVKGSAVTRVGAFMVHPVIFGTFLATLMPMVVGLALIRVGRARRLLLTLTILAGMPALILTLSRAAWLTFTVGCIVLGVLIMARAKLRRRAFLPMLGAGVVLVTVAISFAGPIVSRVYDSNTESLKGREEWAQDAKRMIDVKPVFGFGLNSYAFAAPPYTRLGERGAREFYEKARAAGTPLMPVVHNAYLQWVVEIGVLGMLMHLTIFAMLLTIAWRNLRVHDERLYMLNAACLAGLIGYLVDLNFGNSLRQGSTLREYWVLAAMVCSIRYWRLANSGPARELLPPAIPAGMEAAAR